MSISPSPQRIGARMLATLIALAVALAFAAAGCGGDDNDNGDNDGGGANASAASDDSSAESSDAGDDSPAGNRAQIRAVTAEMRTAFLAGDGETVCDSLAEPGHRDLALYARTLSLPTECVDTVAAIAENNRKEDVRSAPAKIIAIRLDETRAVATIRLFSGGKIQQRYVKQGGNWKLVTFNIGKIAAN